MSRGAKIALGVGAAILALIVLGSIGNSDKKTSSSSSSSSNSGTTSRTLAVAPTTTEPPPPAKPRFTPAQDNAIAKAESYLGYTAFSKQGLIKQLEFDDFSTADGTFAVEHIEANGGVDWNEQAVKKAKSYLDYTSFSLSALVNQLEFDGFTPDQAQYGANTAYGG
ncbi:Ltp family lipoprotein [Mycobacterium sp. D16R24]|uniref:Ltp family lipoprotein n=1 Tax=Mycobacterium sp. D16R24 TaxID=1855656 RepID=UPI00256FBBE0|nr:Ltp family lipoprotein [Mycobacterium sp. D16R24]